VPKKRPPTFERGYRERLKNLAVSRQRTASEGKGDECKKTLLERKSRLEKPNEPNGVTTSQRKKAPNPGGQLRGKARGARRKRYSSGPRECRG